MHRTQVLNSFFAWLVEEGELRDSPAARIRNPRVPEQPATVLTDEQLRRVLAVCQGGGFRTRRDHAILRLLLDTGMRRAELTGLRVADIDLDQNVAWVRGKGGRVRACPFGRKTALALDRYLRERARRPEADCEALWLGQRGLLSMSGVQQIVRYRAEQAGIGHIWPHLFRHTYAHRWLAAGAQAVDLFRRRPLRWLQSAGRFVLTGGDGWLAREPPGAGWQVVRQPRAGARSVLATDLPLDYAPGGAEDYARALGAALSGRTSTSCRQRAGYRSGRAAAAPW